MLKRRRGSFLLVITFGTLMAWVIVSMLTVATSLYSGTRDNARIYSDIQSYRAGTELACYQYITDLQGITVTKDLDSDWISVTNQAIYTQALDAIKATLGADDDPNRWFVSDLTTALSGANLSDPTVLTDLLGRVAGARQSFALSVPEPLTLNWEDPNSWRSSSGAYAAVVPFVVEVNLSVRAETVSERFIVSGLYLSIDITDQDMADGGRHEIATMRLAEREEGVSITRAQIEET